MENRRSFVWGSEIVSERVEMQSRTVVVHLSKKLEANSAEPTGCPRRRQPVVTSTGMVLSGSSGSGLLENAAIVREIAAPRAASVRLIVSSGDTLLQEVSILVFEVLTKQPNSAPCDFIVVHRNSRSGRYTQLDMSST